jgi:hypothetical protein
MASAVGMASRTWTGLCRRCCHGLAAATVVDAISLLIVSIRQTYASDAAASPCGRGEAASGDCFVADELYRQMLQAARQGAVWDYEVVSEYCRAGGDKVLVRCVCACTPGLLNNRLGLLLLRMRPAGP